MFIFVFLFVFVLLIRSQYFSRTPPWATNTLSHLHDERYIIIFVFYLFFSVFTLIGRLRPGLASPLTGRRQHHGLTTPSKNGKVSSSRVWNRDWSWWYHLSLGSWETVATASATCSANLDWASGTVQTWTQCWGHIWPCLSDDTLVLFRSWYIMCNLCWTNK